MSLADRLLLFMAGLAGLSGVALSAAAAHGGEGNLLDTAARFLLVHAPALIGVAALLATGLVHPAVGRLAGYVMVLGLILFCGDLARRAFADAPLFPMAAPTGGVLLMLGWLGIAVAALIRPNA